MNMNNNFKYNKDKYFIKNSNNINLIILKIATMEHDIKNAKAEKEEAVKINKKIEEENSRLKMELDNRAQ